jgi:argininosuccinate lyase
VQNFRKTEVRGAETLYHVCIEEEMVKLWDKGYELEDGIEQFTVGGDYLLDHDLVEWDIAGSIAHARMLSKIGILKKGELDSIKKTLLEILENHKKGSFTIHMSDEDVHTAVENVLTEKLGPVGKKIHTARSRNDQVLLDIRLYSKKRILDIFDAAICLADALIELAEKGKEIPMPGRTHTQLAMPSSVGLWAGAFLESLLDDLEVLKKAYELNDQCPLGSAASYGVPLPIDRQMVSDLLGFAKVQNNVLYANNSRGKVESVILAALGQIMVDLSKMSGDLILFTIPELGYFQLPEQFCTGSSIMPNKKNPDILELVRAKSEKVLAGYSQTLNIIKDLPSGYNRDLQETKEPLMEGLGITEASLRVCALVISGLKINEEKCKKACVPEIFATDKAIEMTAKGIPWRDAYMKVAQELESLKAEDPVKNIKSKTHMGATGNLGLEKSAAKIKAVKAEIAKNKAGFSAVIGKLM